MESDDVHSRQIRGSWFMEFGLERQTGLYANDATDSATGFRVALYLK